MSKINKNLLYNIIIKTLIISILIGIDLWVKQYALTHFDGEDNKLTVISGILTFYFINNPGAAFSLFAGKTYFLIIISLILMIGFFVYECVTPKKSIWQHLGFIFVLSGAIGNFVDRLAFNGHVRDFIRLDFISNFPIFNLADVFLTVGIICYVVDIIFFNKNEIFLPKNNNTKSLEEE